MPQLFLAGGVVVADESSSLQAVRLMLPSINKKQINLDMILSLKE